MNDNLTNIATLNEVLSGMSALCRWTLLGSAGLVAVLLAAAVIRIACRRHRMKCYERFLLDYYGSGPVPELLYRYWEKDITAYNRARRRWPFRVLWREADAGRFTPQPQMPPAVSAGAGVGKHAKRPTPGKAKARPARPAIAPHDPARKPVPKAQGDAVTK